MDLLVKAFFLLLLFLFLTMLRLAKELAKKNSNFQLLKINKRTATAATIAKYRPHFFSREYSKMKISNTV